MTEQIAYMWTDSRYFLQAQKQLDDGWELQKIEVGTPTWFEYAKNTLAGKSIGYDPLLMSAGSTPSYLRSRRTKSCCPSWDFLHSNQGEFD